MRSTAQAFLFCLLLPACDPPAPVVPPPPDPRFEEARRQRERDREEREARERREAEEAQRKAKEEEERAEAARAMAQRQAEAAAHAKALKAEFEADQQRRQEEDFNRVRWLFRESKWSTQAERAIFMLWYAYASIPREKRTAEGLFDVLNEGNAKTADSAALAWNSRLFRRGTIDILFGGRGYTLGDDDDVAVPSLDWAQCVASAKRNIVDARMLKILRNARFASFHCFSVKQSTVTGNNLLDQEQTWKF